MRIAICQMNVLQGQSKQNVQEAEKAIATAVSKGAEVVVLPEMWKSGYDFSNLEKHVEPIEGETWKWLSEQAKQHRIWLIGGSYTLQENENVYNASFTFDPEGKCINDYRKLHLIGLMNEDKYLTGGETYNTFPLGDHLASVIICYDIRFPELIRTYAIEGAKILFVPAQWPIQREEHWLALLKARAIENQMYVVGTNVSGRNDQDVFNGKSMVFDPWGNVVAEAGTEPEILLADIDLEKVDEVRNTIPVFRDRVSHLYRL